MGNISARTNLSETRVLFRLAQGGEIIQDTRQVWEEDVSDTDWRIGKEAEI